MNKKINKQCPDVLRAGFPKNSLPAFRSDDLPRKANPGAERDRGLWRAGSTLQRPY
jgi:hypothetical protein